MEPGHSVAEVKSAEVGVPRASSVLSAVLSATILLGGILTIALMLYLVVSSYSSQPYNDQWTILVFAAKGGDLLSPAWLWERYAEHRLPIPKLFLAADLYCFRDNQKFLLGSIFVFQFLHLVLLSWSMRRLGGWRGALWLTGTGLAAFCLFYLSQWESFIFGFCVNFVLAQLLATSSFVALLLYWNQLQRHPERPSPKFLLLSIFATVACTYCLASGNLLWPILVGAALYLRLPRRAILTLAGAAAVSTAVYFFHYLRPGAHSRPVFSNLGAPLHMLRFCAEYLFGTWAHHGVYFAVLIVFCELAIATIVIFLTLSYLRSFRAFGIQLLLMMTFWLATAAVTAAGRLNSISAGQSRYQTVILLLWCCGGLLLLGCTFFARSRFRHGFLFAQAIVLLVFIAGAIALPYSISQVRRHQFRLDTAAASLITRVYDPQELDWVSWGPAAHDDLLKAVSYLRNNRLSVFAGDRPAMLGQRLQAVYPNISFSDCGGAVESMVLIRGPDGPGLRLTGWAWDTTRRRPASSIIVATEQSIRGFGAVGGWHAGVRDASPSVPGSYMGYVAYVPLPPPGSVISVYAVLPARKPTVCFIGSK